MIDSLIMTREVLTTGRPACEETDIWNTRRFVWFPHPLVTDPCLQRSCGSVFPHSSALRMTSTIPKLLQYQYIHISLVVLLEVFLK